MLLLDGALRVAVHDRTGRRRGWIGSYLEATVTARTNGIGTARFVLPADHRLAEVARQPGARVVIERIREGETPRQIMTGLVVTPGGEGIGPDAVATVDVESDLRVLYPVMAEPVAAAPSTGEGFKRYLLGLSTYFGPCELVVKTILNNNLALAGLGTSVTVAPIRGDGARVGLTYTRQPIMDRIPELLDTADMRIEALWNPATRRVHVDVLPTTLRTRPLSQQSGVLRAAQWTFTAPTVTRVHAYTIVNKVDEVRGRRDAANKAVRAAANTYIAARESYVSAAERAAAAPTDTAKASAAAEANAARADALAAYNEAIIENTAAIEATPGSVTGAARIDTALETAWDIVADARIEVQATEDPADQAAAWDDAITAALLEGRPRVSLTAELAETDTFRYGRTLALGDRVPIAYAPGVTPIVEQVREVTFTHNRADGFTITPTLGESRAPEQVLARAVAQLAARTRR